MGALVDSLPPTARSLPKPELMNRLLQDGALQTPAFVVLVEPLLDNCRNLRRIADDVGAQSLYSLKSLTLPRLIAPMAEILDGFSVSSLYEARLARERAGPSAVLHGTAPGLRPEEMDHLARLCDFISLNSLASSNATDLGRTRGPGSGFG